MITLACMPVKNIWNSFSLQQGACFCADLFSRCFGITIGVEAASVDVHTGLTTLCSSPIPLSTLICSHESLVQFLPGLVNTEQCALRDAVLCVLPLLSWVIFLCFPSKNFHLLGIDVEERSQPEILAYSGRKNIRVGVSLFQRLNAQSTITPGC